jgi:hypothetical protein
LEYRDKFVRNIVQELLEGFEFLEN